MVASPLISVETRGFNDYRTNCNANEIRLTPALLRAQGISLQFDCLLPDDERGTEGMPLIAARQTMDDDLLHNVMIVATMANDVCTFDCDTGELIWKQRVGNAVKSSPALDMYSIADHWGILSTPVLNLATRTIYVVAMHATDGQIGDAAYYLHALNILDGSEQVAPVDLTLATYQPPGGLPLQAMSQVPRKQRPALTFDSAAAAGGSVSAPTVDTVFVSFGSFNEDADTNRGWIIAVDVSSMPATQPTIAAAITTSSAYSGSGLWQSGGGLAMDDSGFLFGMTGNGAFQPPTDLGECMFKVKYTPKSSTAPAILAFVDWWSPFTDTGREGADPTLADVSLIKGRPADEPGGTSNMNDPGDQDYGAGQPLYLPMSLTGYSKNVVLGAGKDGFLYVMDAGNLGQTQLADFAPDKIAGNYAKLLSPPYGLTYYPGGLDIAPSDLATLSTTYGGYTHHQHAGLVFYKSPRFGPMIFAGGENGPVRAFQFNADFTLTYLGCGAEIASAGLPPPGGMPGTMMTGSCNGVTPDTFLLWCMQPLGDANKSITPGRLIVYAGDSITNGQIEKLWDSLDWGPEHAFAFNKFNIGNPANGRFCLPTYDARVRVYA